MDPKAVKSTNIGIPQLFLSGLDDNPDKIPAERMFGTVKTLQIPCQPAFPDPPGARNGPAAASHFTGLFTKFSGLISYAQDL